MINPKPIMRLFTKDITGNLVKDRQDSYLSDDAGARAGTGNYPPTDDESLLATGNYSLQ